ncbi:NAD(P)/FAD-dependent oxidoreductase [Streptomyces olivaceoviridis]|uniref:NAD(P)/FAD-dependent oxidoreductase n=1 Tax=Streptomyces olivaceoviridis TaxID=1921 RepID=A0ABW7VQB9_STROI|nr:FAD-dependent oxidoreductase [Streptomyces corchorusii]
MTTSPGVVVVGASAAGLSAAEGLRRSGYDGPVTLVGDEPHLPYDRPPLSKQLLAGEWPPERLSLRSARDFTDLDLRLRLGVPAVSLRTSAHLLHLADGSRLPYDTLVVATGVRARTPDGAAAGAGTHVLRTLEDALALREELSGHPRLVIVGGGFVGVEAAAVARALDCEVTLVTGGDAPLTDVLGETVAQVLAEVHREHGVRLVTGSRAVEVLRERGRTVGVRLATGRVVPADAVLAGVGARPNTEWLAGSGVPVGDGVDCDVCLYAGDDVWAAGDVASWPDAVSGERLRVEHRINATEQGQAVARNILAGRASATAFRTVPYFWSDQYGLRVQVYGRTRGADAVHVVDGSTRQRRFTAVYVRDGHVVGALGIGMFRPLRALRELVAAHAPWPAPHAEAAVLDRRG